MAFKCPLKFEGLQETEDEKVRFCTKCEKNVYHCDNQEERDMRRKNKQCVAFFVKIDDLIDEWMGEDEYIPDDIDANPEYEADT
jgi:hypothetical protein